MMDKPNPKAYAAMRAAMTALLGAHAAVSQGIATHAEKHEVALDQARMEASQRAAIERGIASQSGQV